MQLNTTAAWKQRFDSRHGKGEMRARSARKKLQLHETQRIHFVFS